MICKRCDARLKDLWVAAHNLQIKMGSGACEIFSALCALEFALSPQEAPGNPRRS